ncbi:MAG: hypothetical protein OEQ13_11335, partial [Acidobacteriota bacterium]|nr:hypothetical protein [Acidobacteriota bacterium]
MSDRSGPPEPLAPGQYEGPNVALPEGETAFDLPLGPVLLRVKNVPVPWAPFVTEHYGAFVSAPDDDAQPDVVVECREEA